MKDKYEDYQDLRIDNIKTNLELLILMKRIEFLSLLTMSVVDVIIKASVKVSAARMMRLIFRSVRTVIKIRLIV